MFEKIKNIFNEKDEKKKTENLIAFLIILVVTIILINKIWNDDSKVKDEMYQRSQESQLVSTTSNKEVALVSNGEEDCLEKRLEDILSKISGVGKVDVLITYQKENPLKIEGAIVAAEGVRKY